MNYIELRMYNRQNYVLYVHDLISNHQQITHVWKPSTNFNNRTINEIKESVKKAQGINFLTARGQPQYELPTIDGLFDILLKEEKDPELPQSASNNLAQEVAEP